MHEKILRILKKPISSITKQDIRGFLELHPSNHYVKSIRVFFGKYLGCPELVQSFKIPTSPIKPKIVPSKEELRNFYNELKTTKERAIFLLLASSGLRFHEVMELKRSDIDLERRMIKPKTDS